MKNKRFFGFRFFAFAVLFLLLHRACSPPVIDSEYAEKLLSISQVYQDVRHTTDLPVVLSGQVMSSLFVGSLGGFFFLQDTANHQTIVCLTKDFPPPDGATVSVLGVVKPFLCKGDLNVLYFKTKEVELDRPISASLR